MKFKWMKFCFFSGIFFGYSQTGIGLKIPNNSAQLEVFSQNKGVLLPRVALASDVDRSTITTGNVNSLLVYNTTDNNSIKPGYYYWFSERWQKLANSLDLETLIEPSVTTKVSGSGFNSSPYKIETHMNFFYAPSLVLPMNLSSNAYNSGLQGFQVDLHAVYQKQYGMLEGASSTKNPSATNLTLFTKKQLNYYITYYDNTVFTDVSVGDDGVLFYKIIPSSNVTENTYMNVVFELVEERL